MIPDKNTRYHLFTKGKRIAKVGQEARVNHLITDGIVDLIYKGIVIKSLKSNELIKDDFFSEKDGVYARARTSVKTVSMEFNNA